MKKHSNENFGPCDVPDFGKVKKIAISLQKLIRSEIEIKTYVQVGI